MLCTLTACGKSQAVKDAEAKEAAFRDKYTKAKALFEERCKTAGVVIKRTVKDVEGIELAKVRQPIPWGGKEYFDPMYPEAAMAAEHRGDEYVKQFLMPEIRDATQPNKRGVLSSLIEPCDRCLPPIFGYRYVEYVDSVSGRRQIASFAGGHKQVGWSQPLRIVTLEKPPAQYALDYEDLVYPADRALWIAGTKLKVIDKKSGETIAELTRFVWDSSFGANTSGRWPWQHANAHGNQTCPNIVGTHGFDSRYFIDTVLIPKQGD
jgi:hypothetical protein